MKKPFAAIFVFLIAAFSPTQAAPPSALAAASPLTRFRELVAADRLPEAAAYLDALAAANPANPTLAKLASDFRATLRQATLRQLALAHPPIPAAQLPASSQFDYALIAAQLKTLPPPPWTDASLATARDLSTRLSVLLKDAPDFADGWRTLATLAAGTGDTAQLQLARARLALFDAARAIPSPKQTDTPSTAAPIPPALLRADLPTDTVAAFTALLPAAARLGPLPWDASRQAAARELAAQLETLLAPHPGFVEPRVLLAGLRLALDDQPAYERESARLWSLGYLAPIPPPGRRPPLFASAPDSQRTQLALGRAAAPHLFPSTAPQPTAPRSTPADADLAQVTTADVLFALATRDAIGGRLALALADRAGLRTSNRPEITALSIRLQAEGWLATPPPAPPENSPASASQL